MLIKLPKGCKRPRKIRPHKTKKMTLIQKIKKRIRELEFPICIEKIPPEKITTIREEGDIIKFFDDRSYR